MLLNEIDHLKKFTFHFCVLYRILGGWDRALKRALCVNCHFNWLDLDCWLPNSPNWLKCCGYDICIYYFESQNGKLIPKSISGLSISFVSVCRGLCAAEEQENTQNVAMTLNIFHVFCIGNGRCYCSTYLILYVQSHGCTLYWVLYEFVCEYGILHCCNAYEICLGGFMGEGYVIRVWFIHTCARPTLPRAARSTETCRL